MPEIHISTLQRIGMQVILLNEISRSIIFARNLQGETSKPKVFIKSSLLKQSVILWCQIFGSRGEDLHWSKVTSKQDFIKTFEKASILSATGFTEEQWSEYHETLKNLRDKFFAHFDMDEFEARMPSMDSALIISEKYRDWLYEMLLEAMKTNAISIGFVKSEEFNKLIESEWKP